MNNVGPDISEHDGDLDFSIIKQSFDFVILCCGYGRNRKNQDDAMFLKNAAKCQAVGLPFGVYLYSYATDVQGAKSEADHILRLTERLNPLYGYWYCIEEAEHKKKTLVQNCKVFLDKLERRGCYAGIRSTYNILTEVLNHDCLSRYDKWVVQHNDSCHYPGAFGIWQFTDYGIIPGLHGGFCLNKAYFNYSAVNGISQLPPTDR